MKNEVNKPTLPFINPPSLLNSLISTTDPFPLLPSPPIHYTFIFYIFLTWIPLGPAPWVPETLA